MLRALSQNDRIQNVLNNLKVMTHPTLGFGSYFEMTKIRGIKIVLKKFLLY